VSGELNVPAAEMAGRAVELDAHDFLSLFIISETIEFRKSSICVILRVEFAILASSRPLKVPAARIAGFADSNRCGFRGTER